MREGRDIPVPMFFRCESGWGKSDNPVTGLKIYNIEKKAT